MTEPSGPPPLLTDSQRTGLPGGPYDQALVELAAGVIRGECGWHIAPSWSEDRLLDHRGGEQLLLPTLHLVDVTTVEDRAGNTITGWDWSETGVLTRRGGWPVGPRAVHVVFEHGHTVPPTELVALVAELAPSFRSVPAGTKSFQRTVGGVTTNRTYADAGPVRAVLSAFGHVLRRHTVDVPTW